MTTGAITHSKLQSNCHHQTTNTHLFTGLMPFLSLNLQPQNTEGNTNIACNNYILWHSRYSYIKWCSLPDSVCFVLVILFIYYCLPEITMGQSHVSKHMAGQ